jgi:hypothetical protein
LWSPSIKYEVKKWRGFSDNSEQFVAEGIDQRVFFYRVPFSQRIKSQRWPAARLTLVDDKGNESAIIVQARQTWRNYGLPALGSVC